MKKTKQQHINKNRIKRSETNQKRGNHIQEKVKETDLGIQEMNFCIDDHSIKICLRKIRLKTVIKVKPS